VASTGTDESVPVEYADVTQLYAERNEALAAEIMAEIG
jgi:hypothetical protein